MQKLLEEITGSWVAATRENFTGHPIAQKIRNDFPDLIRLYTSNKYPSFEIRSSAGAGNWAKRVFILSIYLK